MKVLAVDFPGVFGKCGDVGIELWDGILGAVLEMMHGISEDNVVARDVFWICLY